MKASIATTNKGAPRPMRQVWKKLPMQPFVTAEESKSFLAQARPNTGRNRLQEPAPPHTPAMIFESPSTA